MILYILSILFYNSSPISFQLCPTIQMLNTPFALCPKCTSNFPSLSINKHRIDLLSISCNCGYAATMPLHAYLTHYKRFRVKSTTSPLCKKHNRLSCKKCIKKTKNDNVIDKDFFKNTIETITNHIKNYVTPLRTHALGILLRLKNEIEVNYAKTVSLCNDISSFIRILAENYTPMLNETVETHCDLWLYKCSDENSFQSINAYLKNFSLYEKPLEIVSFSSTSKCTNLSIKSMTLLSDGRIAVHDTAETIYIGRPCSKRDLKFDIEIRSHNKINSLCQLDSGELLASGDTSIDVYSVKENSYEKISEISTEEVIYKLFSISNRRFVVCGDKTLFIYAIDDTHPTQKIQIDFDIDDNSTAVTYIKSNELVVTYTDDKLIVCSMISYQIVSVVEVDCEGCDDDAVHLEAVDAERVMIGRNRRIVIVNVFEGRKEFEVEDSKIGSVTAMRRLNERYVVCACKMEAEFRKVNYLDIKFLIFDCQLRKYTMDKCNQDEIIKEIIRVDERSMMTTNGHSIEIWKGE